MTTQGALLVLAASVLWGTTGTAASMTSGVGPLAIGAAAMGIGGLLQGLRGWSAMGASMELLGANRRLVALGAVSVAVYPLAFYPAMDLAGVAVGTVVSLGSAPLASAVLERVVDQRTLGRRWAVGAAFGLTGIIFLGLAGADGGLAGADTGRADIQGVLCALIAGASYAAYSWSAHRLMIRGVPPRAAMGAMFGAGGMLLLPVLLLTGAGLVASWTNAAVAFYLALVPMFVGYVLFGMGLRRVRASSATTLSLAEPLVATLLALIVLGEWLTWSGWLGMALVAGSLAILTLPSGKSAWAG